MVGRFRAAVRVSALPLAILLAIVPVVGLSTRSVAGAAVVQLQSQPYTWKNAVINGGGFITGIVFHPSVQNLAYARTDIGGLYRWNQAAGRWVPLLDWINWDNWGYSGVWSVALDPNNGNTVYAAVGMYTNGWDPNNGAVLKSTDQGNTWTINPLPFKGAGNMAGRGCGERLAVDPNNSSILYLAATGDQATTYGLWKSTSGGTSWSQVTSFPAVGDWVEVPGDFFNYNNTYQGLWWVQFDKRFVTSGVTQNIYVGVATKNGPTVYRSTNGGASFTATGATGLPTTEAADFHAVPGREGDIWLAGGATGSAYGLWHSTDSGSTFTKLSNVSLADAVGFGMAATGQTYPALYIQGTVSTIRGYYRSTDAGATWVRINDDAHQWYACGTKSVTGDPRIYGRVYISTNGRGIIYGDPQ